MVPTVGCTMRLRRAACRPTSCSSQMRPNSSLSDPHAVDELTRALIAAFAPRHDAPQGGHPGPAVGIAVLRGGDLARGRLGKPPGEALFG